MHKPGRRRGKKKENIFQAHKNDDLANSNKIIYWISVERENQCLQIHQKA
jgi:hypothetical protein